MELLAWRPFRSGACASEFSTSIIQEIKRQKQDTRYCLGQAGTDR